ncbi:Uncharacterized protein OS=Planctomyces maris DSM 8797 GN=PM8797T_20643 PE=4 SV=1: PQQ_2 [Tuwongella immobilis]|uniref:Pyrrolo-quinoline quinone repeat domain-containing protein n=2 Tax=Tuwongella immobilis TaxID=692036 RepID=A0A6C2YKG8_9BACT|nr:Uncharacterized protein OS=Planctomyces maris DSM 8797 GN=PM8797T_20643 PE=4 SV=1: PQQ_2 [Tuwongella immobilis]VTR99866.1 Uncharacterized protein OS=Planctomyces maris DSM 8797 GN=PM8797T_20643 PE=4 SV=1: PQQ_2 [Tuwongella immobilis]
MLKTMAAAWTFPTLAGVTTVAAADAPLATWPQWRGPTRDGIVPGNTWPKTIDDSNFQQIWRVDNLGPSYSGTIVATDRVFTTATVDKKTEVVSAYSRKDGKLLWQSSWEGAMTVPFFAAANGSWIRATPTYDGESLFVGGIRDVLVCVNAADGKERWRVDFVKELKSTLPAFGMVCSPLVDETAVYVQAGGGFLKLDKKTGKVLWNVLPEKDAMMGSAFSSPTFATVAGQPQILVQTRSKLAGVTKDDGKVLWTRDIPSFRGMNILTPTAKDDVLFTSAYGSKSFGFNLDKVGESFSLADRWTTNREGYMSTPVVVNGHIYLHLRNQRVACLELATGKECWVTEKAYGKYWSMVAQGDKILALDERGILFLLKADPKEFTVISEKKLPNPETWAHLAVAGDELFIRDLVGLTAYRWK